jgi:diguanylate cyclase (GGDEF)-like protein
MQQVTRHGPVPDAVAWQRTNMVFRQTIPLVIGGLAMTLIGAVGYWRTGAAWLLGWLVAVPVIFAARLALAHAYHRRPPGDPPRLWARRYALGAWATGAHWGMVALVVVIEPDLPTHLLILLVQSRFFTNAARQNSPVPEAAFGTPVLALLPMVGACLAVGGTLYTCFAAFAAMLLVAALWLGRAASAKTLALLVSIEERRQQVEQVSRANAELVATNVRLEAMTRTDALTGLLNRRGFDEALMQAWSRARRGSGLLSLLLIDIDHFKQYNDTHGHMAGDACLQRVAQAVAQAQHRPGDITARYGGEELAVILPDTDGPAGMLAAERLRRAVEALAIPHAGARVTVSIGVASLGRDDPATPEVLLARADAALYAAKRDGRNRSRLAEAA